MNKAPWPGLNRAFLYATTKEKNRVCFMRIKNVCSSNTMKRTKRQSIEWEKIFANHTSNKGLYI
jgi:hypothetical protein